MATLFVRSDRLLVSRVVCAAVAAGALVVAAPPGGAMAQRPSFPEGRSGMALAFDEPRSEVVLFGGGRTCCEGDFHDDTWIWDGGTWEQRLPSTAPPPRTLSALAYDVARAEVVLFGGRGNAGELNDTWTWDGWAWTERHPVHVPPVRDSYGMAYDAVNNEVVMFGGYQGCWQCNLADTWTWDGTDWHLETPAATPPARDSFGMAYDAARGEIVLFGGVNYFPTLVNDTWTWDGTTWTDASPPNAPSPRGYHAMGYDPATEEVVLFGGGDYSVSFNETWTWEGSTWTKRSSENLPRGRSSTALAFDGSSGSLLMYGGQDALGNPLGDTWSWDGIGWRVPLVPQLQITPTMGPPGTHVTVSGTGFASMEQVKISFVDADTGKAVLGILRAGRGGTIVAELTIPEDATTGSALVLVESKVSGQRTRAVFLVTPDG